MRALYAEDAVHIRVVIPPVDVVFSHHVAQDGKSVGVDAKPRANLRNAQEREHGVDLEPVRAELEQRAERMRNRRLLQNAALQRKRDFPFPARAENRLHQRRIRAPVGAEHKGVGRARIRFILKEPVEGVARRLQLAPRRMARMHLRDNAGEGGKRSGPLVANPLAVSLHKVKFGRENAAGAVCQRAQQPRVGRFEHVLRHRLRRRLAPLQRFAHVAGHLAPGHFPAGVFKPIVVRRVEGPERCRDGFGYLL